MTIFREEDRFEKLVFRVRLNLSE